MGIKISSNISCYKGCCKTKLPEKFIVDGHGFEKRNVKLEMYFELETGSYKLKQQRKLNQIGCCIENYVKMECKTEQIIIKLHFELVTAFPLYWEGGVTRGCPSIFLRGIFEMWGARA